MMPGVRFEEIWKALYSAYTKRSLEQMLRTRLSIDLGVMVGDGPVRDMTFDLLGEAERQGWEVDLVREAYRFNPGNAELLGIYAKYGLAPGAAVQAGGKVTDAAAATVAAEGFEKTVKDHLALLDINVWRERLARIETQVCRVEINGNAMGTGFLVGPDAVLTNYHVLEPALRSGSAAGVTCRFDYKVLADKSRSPGVVLALDRTNWDLDHSLYSDGEKQGQPDSGTPTEDELDYALVRLERPIGNQPVNPKAESDSAIRGWVYVPHGAAPAFQAKMPLIIVQHPDGSPLKLAIDTEAVLGVNDKGTRVRYATNTEPGSSGSPCFDMDWNLVALHHYGDPAYAHPKYNQGIPINMVRDRITKQNRADVLGQANN